MHFKTAVNLICTFSHVNCMCTLKKIISQTSSNELMCSNFVVPFRTFIWMWGSTREKTSTGQFSDFGRSLLSIFEKSASVSLGEIFYKQPYVSKSLKSKYLSNKILHQNDLPLYKILCWTRSFLSNFCFKRVSVFAIVNIFHVLTSAKT